MFLFFKKNYVFPALLNTMVAFYELSRHVCVCFGYVLNTIYNCLLLQNAHVYFFIIFYFLDSFDCYFYCLYRCAVNKDFIALLSSVQVDDSKELNINRTKATWRLKCRNISPITGASARLLLLWVYWTHVPQFDRMGRRKRRRYVNAGVKCWSSWGQNTWYKHQRVVPSRPTAPSNADNVRQTSNVTTTMHEISAWRLLSSPSLSASTPPDADSEEIKKWFPQHKNVRLTYRRDGKIGPSIWIKMQEYIFVRKKCKYENY